jgi:hypothetical protein
MDTMKQPKRLFILLIVGAMVIAYLLGTVTNSGAANAVFSKLSIAAITPQQWAAVEASNALLLSEESFTVFLPLSLRH